MKQKATLKKISKEELSEILGHSKKRKIIKFLNANDFYYWPREESYRICLMNKDSINCIDGFPISAFLFLKHLKKVPRNQGPVFTEYFLNSEYSKNKNHFFIGLSEEDRILLKKRFPHITSAQVHNPSYIKGLHFPPSEINEIAKKINHAKPDFVWVGVGSPKQNILSTALFYKTKAPYFINIGAALDYLLGKKKPAPRVIRKLGIEWLYRLITDFKYSHKKVIRSFIAIRHLNAVKLEN